MGGEMVFARVTMTYWYPVSVLVGERADDGVASLFLLVVFVRLPSWLSLLLRLRLVLLLFFLLFPNQLSC